MRYLLAVGVFLAQLTAAQAGQPAEERHPNVLMICIDDLNDWTGFLGGHPQVKTPHMDALARRSRVFTNAHCAVPVCSASRVSILSGVAATTHGSYEIGPKYQDLQALRNVPTLHAFFKQNGYRTITGGKVLHHGFSGRLAGDIDQDLGRKKSPRPKKALNRPAHWSGAWDWGAHPETEAQMSDYQLAESAAELLAEGFDRPFLMSVGFFRPHVPLYVPPKWFELYDEQRLSLPDSPLSDLDDLPDNFLSINNYAVAPTHAEVLKHSRQRSLTRAYLASISFVDHCVGVVTKALQQSRHADNTIVVLWSDHGFHLAEKQHWAKRTLWEESTRVPLLIAGPGIGGGSDCREPVSLLDVFPTLVDLCDLPANPNLEGVSLLPQLKDSTAARRYPAITSSYFGNHSIRTKNWRLIVYEDGAQELYDHRTDSDEFNNLADDPAHTAIRDELMQWVPSNPVPEVKARSERKRERRN